jgi:fatty-acyl-CoA synthase
MQQPSYVHGAHHVPLSGKTIGAYLDDIAVRHAEREALVVVHQNVRWTYRQFHEKVNRLAAGLLKLGLVPGDRIGIMRSGRSATGRSPITRCRAISASWKVFR